MSILYVRTNEFAPYCTIPRGLYNIIIKQFSEVNCFCCMARGVRSKSPTIFTCKILGLGPDVRFQQKLSIGFTQKLLIGHIDGSRPACATK